MLRASCQELKKCQEEKCQSEENTQPPRETQPSPMQSQPPPPKPAELSQRQVQAQAQRQTSQPQPPPPPPQPPPQPRQQKTQDPLTQYTSQHNLQNSPKPGLHLGSVATHQTGQQSNYFNDKFQGGWKIPQPGKCEASHPCPIVQNPHVTPPSVTHFSTLGFYLGATLSECVYANICRGWLRRCQPFLQGRVVRE